MIEINPKPERIAYSKFTDCFVRYLGRYQKEKRIFQACKDALVRAIDSLIAHLDTSKEDRKELLELRRNL